MTCDTWQVTHDTWHLTPDTWHVTHDGEWTFSQNGNFLAVPVWDWQCLEDSERKDDRLNQSISNAGVCRTAPATPGLLIIKMFFKKKFDKTTENFPIFFFNFQKLTWILSEHNFFLVC